MQPSLPLRLGGEFDQGVLDVRRELRQTASPRPVGELVVGPEVLEHLDEVALAAAEEPAHPDARLLRLVQVAQVVAEDSPHPLGVLAVADEAADLVAEGLQLGVGVPAGHLGDALVEQPVPARVLLVDLAVGHPRSPPSCAVIGTAR